MPAAKKKKPAAKKPAAKKPAAKKPAKKAAKKAKATKKVAAKKPAPSTKSAWEKLYIKGGTLLLANAPSGAEKHFVGSPASVTTSAPNADTVLFFASQPSDLSSSLANALGALTDSSTLWIAYQKGRKDLHRDLLWEAMKPHGFEGVRLVALDDAWSAMMFRRAS